MTTIIYLLLIATSLLYAPLFPNEEFETPKAFALISFACFCFLLAPYKRILKDKIAIGLSIFLASCTLSAIFSLNQSTSLFGNPKMPNGLLIWASYLIFYLIASHNLKDIPIKISIIRILMGTSFIVAGYAILQATGHDYKQWFGLPAEHGYIRPPSTLGHPNFMAAYLSMTIPFALWTVDFSKVTIERILAFIVVICSIAAIIFSESRGIWWAALGSIGIYYGMKRPPLKTITAISCIILCVLGVALNTSTAVKEAFLERSKLMLHLGGPRTEYLKGAYRIWKRYPILGAGTDSFELAYQHQRSPTYWQIERNGSPHRAHNEFLNILATQGLIGALSIILLTLLILERIKRSTSTFLLPATASISAFYIQEVSSFHCIATVLILLISLCFLCKDKEINLHKDAI